MGFSLLSLSRKQSQGKLTQNVLGSRYARPFCILVQVLTNKSHLNTPKENSSNLLLRLGIKNKVQFLIGELNHEFVNDLLVKDINGLMTDYKMSEVKAKK